MGVFICMESPTKGMLEASNHSGLYSHPANGQTYPKVQIISVPEILSGKRPALPPILLPYFQAQARVTDDTAEMLPLDSTPSGDPQAATTPHPAR